MWRSFLSPMGAVMMDGNHFGRAGGVTMFIDLEAA
jgi:hypothetical protein